jgi:hypothetical protein
MLDSERLERLAQGPYHEPLARFEAHGWIIDYQRLMGFGLFPRIVKGTFLRHDFALFPESGKFSTGFRGYVPTPASGRSERYLVHLGKELKQRNIDFGWSQSLVFSLVAEVEYPELLEGASVDDIYARLGKHFFEMQNIAASCAHVLKMYVRELNRTRSIGDEGTYIDGLAKFTLMGQRGDGAPLHS